MRKPALAPFAVALLALSSPAQDVAAADLDALEAKVRLRLADDGQMLFAPDPATGKDTFVPLLREGPGLSIEALGMFGFGMFLLGGPTDLASFADAPGFFERLGGEDAALLQAIERPTAAATWPEVLQTLLALRAVEDRTLKAAIPLVERVAAADEAADPFVRRAAIEAAAALRDHPRPPLDVEHEDLGTVLARVPPSAQIVVRIDAFRLPPLRAITGWGRTVGREVTRRHALAANRFFSETDYLERLRLAESAAVLPYELARRYGNHRIDRIVLAIRPPEGAMAIEPSIWASFDGVFDVDRVRAELEAAGVDFATDDDGTLRMPMDVGFEFRLGARHAELWNRDFRADGQNEPPAGVADALRAGAQLALWVAPDLDLPDAARRVKPDWMRLGVPPDGAGALRLEGAWADATGAAAFRGVLASVPGLAERAVAGIESFDPVLDALDAMEIELDGARLVATMSIPNVDVDSLLRELVAAGLFD